MSCVILKKFTLKIIQTIEEPESRRGGFWLILKKACARIKRSKKASMLANSLSGSGGKTANAEIIETNWFIKQKLIISQSCKEKVVTLPRLLFWFCKIMRGLNNDLDVVMLNSYRC
jgi:hypothetical protein